MYAQLLLGQLGAARSLTDSVPLPRDAAGGRETRPWRVHVAARTGTVEDSDTGSDTDGESEDGEGWETGDEMEEWEEGPPREVVPERDK